MSPAWFHIHQIGKLRKFLTIDQTKTVIHAFVTSKLDQNNSLLAGLPENLISKLQRVQNASAKIIFRAKKHDHVTAILIQLHWLPVQQRIIFKILLLTFKCLHGEGPAYLRNLLEWYNPSRSLRSSNRLMLKVPRTFLKSYVFEAVAPCLWNSLPVHVRDSSSMDIFKQSLKTYLFKSVYQC